MGKRRKMTEEKRDAVWDATGPADKQFLGILGLIVTLIGREGLHYCVLPTRLENALQKLDRAERFQILVECLGFLLNAPAWLRFKRTCGACAAKTPRRTARPTRTKRTPKGSRSK